MTDGADLARVLNDFGRSFPPPLAPGANAAPARDPSAAPTEPPTTAFFTPILDAGVRAVRAADFQRDGTLDLVVLPKRVDESIPDPPRAFIYHGGPDGGFVLAPYATLAFSSERPAFDARIADANGDLRPDVALLGPDTLALYIADPLDTGLMLPAVTFTLGSDCRTFENAASSLAQTNPALRAWCSRVLGESRR